ncbi:MAG TPA: sulfite oxidase [Vicinamibacterales bacterium]|nr:sulfite oxidase [Vicinamibacterales bacterium]
MAFSRRDWLSLAAQASAVGLVGHYTPWASVLAQSSRAVAAGKEKLLVKSLRPPDYEAPVALLDSFITPVEHFYVRSHMPVPPALDASTWTLQIEGEITAATSLTLDELRKMPAVTVTAILECAGNGRAFYDPPVAGIQWGKGAVGNARWTGVRLADVLKRAGLKATGKFIHMNGADRPLGTMPDFVRQLPIDKARDPDTVLAYDMNGQPLHPQHGFPLRAIVPGWEGAYSVKWLNHLRVADRESDSFWVATGYRYPTKRVAPGAAVDAKDMAPLTGLVVKSLITRPLEGATLPPGRVEVAGFAWAGEDDIARVDVSTDQGATWQPARLVGERVKYSWRRFEFAFDAKRPESYLILARATDSTGRTQPMTPPWNPSGYLWNAPDAVRVEIKA